MSAPNTAAFVKEYREKGFAVVERLFDPSEVAELNTAITEILAVSDIGSVAEVEPGDNGMARRIWSPTKQHSAFERAVALPELLDHVEALIGPDILFHYSKLHLKAPQVGSVVDWHQDFAYYPHTNTDLVTALVYLDDTTTENSALQVVPGSHHRGLANHYVDGHFRGKVVADTPDPALAVAIEAPAGSAIFIHPLLLHYSSPNRSDRYRRAFLPAYRAADAYPIHFGPHAGHNEAGVKLLRGKVSDTARVEAGAWRLPFAERPFGSLFQLQEGTHLTPETATTGYATLEEAK